MSPSSVVQHKAQQIVRGSHKRETSPPHLQLQLQGLVQLPPHLRSQCSCLLLLLLMMMMTPCTRVGTTCGMPSVRSHMALYMNVMFLLSVGNVGGAGLSLGLVHLPDLAALRA